MSEAIQEGNLSMNRGGAPHFRFRDLLHRLFSMANQGYLRTEFLQMATGAMLELLGCDTLEVRVADAGKVCRCRAALGAGVSRFICEVPGPEGQERAAGAEGPSIHDRIMDSVLRGEFLAAAPFSTRGGSFWTGDATRPVLIREGGGRDARPRSLVIGGGQQSLAYVPIPVDERIRGVLHLGCRKADAFARDDIQLFETVAETLGVAVAFQASQWALRERVKELDCLYGIAQVAQSSPQAMAGQMQAIAELLPPAWQYPDLTLACITLDGQSYTTPGFQATAWMQSADIRVNGKVRGAVAVAYGRAMPDFDEGPFLQEERNLIEEVARQVGLIVDRWEDAKAKAQLFHMLEQRRE